MNLSNTLRELLWENPMTLEATRTWRRTLRSGSSNENPYATRNLNRFLLGTLVFLYVWTMFGIRHSNEDISAFLLGCELVLLTLAVPCSLYGAIAVEREKQTYESLIMTRLTPAQIVCGKLWWRIGMILGLMGLFVPLLIVSCTTERHHNLDFTAAQLAWTQVQIFAWSVFLAAFSLWVSAKSKKGITALLGIVASVLAFLIMVPVLLSLFGGLNAMVRPGDPFGYHNGSFAYSPQEKSLVDFYRRVMIMVLAAGLLYSLNPFLMITSLPQNSNYGWSDTLGVDKYWQMLGSNYWGVAVFAVLTLFFIRAAIKTLRGLEMPVAEKVRRSRLAFVSLPKGDD